jgi:hypothetical protein
VSERTSFHEKVDRSDSLHRGGRGDGALKVKVTLRSNLPVRVLERQAMEDDMAHQLPCFRLPLHKDQPLQSRRNYLGLLHVLAWKGNIGDFLSGPVKIPLT